MGAAHPIRLLPGFLAISAMLVSKFSPAHAQSRADPVGSAFNWSIVCLIVAPYAVAGAIGGWLFYRYWSGSGSLLTIVGRAFRLRCPRCGSAALYASCFRMHERCAACGLRYEREQGYFVGAIYFNYALTVGVAAGAVITLDWTIGLTLAEQLALGIALAALVPLACFRLSRSLWLTINYLLTSADEIEDEKS